MSQIPWIGVLTRWNHASTRRPPNTTRSAGIATTVTSRNDATKSLWTTVIGSLTQTFWALFGLVVGVPREVWLVVAIIAAALMLLYLYRKITLAKSASGNKFRLKTKA